MKGAATGTARPRIKMAEIAAAAEVSVPTVSKVLNGRADVAAATRQRVEQTMETLGYARAKRRNGFEPKLLDLVFTELSPYASELTRGAQDAALAKGCRLTVSALPDEARQRAWIESLERSHTDGVILVVAELSQVHRQRLEKLRVPIVIVDPMADPPPNIPSVGVTNWVGGMRATEHLIALGHVRIGMVAGDTRQMFYRSRLDGYRAALEHAGLQADPRLVAIGTYNYAEAFAEAKQMLHSPNPPTAIFACSDIHAMGIYEAARVSGLRIPDDLSVVGFDDIPMAEWASPPLTTMHQPLAQMAELAVHVLLDRQDWDRSLRMELETRLVVRASTAPPRAQSKRLSEAAFQPADNLA
jgi:LacI family transcriptional regulator